MQASMRHMGHEQQRVYRQFSIRWTPGFMYTRIYDIGDDALTLGQIEAWSNALAEVVPQLGDQYVSVIDTRDIGEVPRGLWMALLQHTASLPLQPTRRALLAADGWAGDSQTEAVQLVTAGNVRAFRSSQVGEMMRWLDAAGIVASERLRSLAA